MLGSAWASESVSVSAPVGLGVARRREDAEVAEVRRPRVGVRAGDRSRDGRPRPLVAEGPQPDRRLVHARGVDGGLVVRDGHVEEHSPAGVAAGDGLAHYDVVGPVDVDAVLDVAAGVGADQHDDGDDREAPAPRRYGVLIRHTI